MFKGPFFKIVLPALLISATVFFQACKKDDAESTANATVEITDGPIDDAQVKAVFITVTDIKIDGKSWSGFKGKATFELSAYQKGLTKILGDGELDAKTYSQITLVLDTEKDASGNAPGCYVVDAQNVKSKLEGGTELSVNATGQFVADATTKTAAVIDFDLRKALTYKSGTTGYAFVTEAELNTALKLTTASNTGVIKGKCADVISGSEKIVVYAYKKGSFDLNVEKLGQGTSQIQFKNAAGSAVVASDGSFQIAFLDKGDYELHFISYSDANNDGKLEAKGELQLNLAGTLNLLNLVLGAKASLDLTLVVTGIILF